MKDRERNPAEIKYSSEFFVNDFLVINAMLKEKIKLIKDIDFSDIQKAQLAGTIMATTAMFQIFINKLKEWGYLSNE